MSRSANRTRGSPPNPSHAEATSSWSMLLAVGGDGVLRDYCMTNFAVRWDNPTVRPIMLRNKTGAIITQRKRLHQRLAGFVDGELNPFLPFCCVRCPLATIVLTTS